MGGGESCLDKLRSKMNNFSDYSLRMYLGNDIVDTLIEWTPSDQQVFNKRRLIEMILTIHGFGILKNKGFREDLLKRCDENEILEFRSYLKGDLQQSKDLQKIIKVVAESPWRDNAISQHLLELFQIDCSILNSNTEQFDTEINVENDEQFYELLDYQYYIKQRVLNYLNSDVLLERMLVHMPTGTGKTKTAMHTIVNYYNFTLKKKGLIIWIAHTTELLQQALDTFNNVWKHLGDGSTIAYRVWGNGNLELQDEPYNGFMFLGLSKLMSISDLNPQLFEKLIIDTRLIVYDEAHKIAAGKTRSIIEKFMVKKPDMENRALLGLTATPGRSTDESFDNTLLSNMFSNKIISIDTKILNAMNLSTIKALNSQAEEDIIKYFQNRRILAKIVKEELTYLTELSDTEIRAIKVKTVDNGYEDFTKEALEVIGMNQNRNIEIMKRLRQLNAEGKPTIVFACSVKHAKLLSSMLTLEDIPNSLVVADISPMERKKAIQAFKNRSNKTNIIINYEVLTTGFDSTNIQCVFIARPTQSIVLYSQMLGRGLRGPQMGGNETCLLIDVKDNLQSYNENMAFSHFKNYWRG